MKRQKILIIGCRKGGTSLLCSLLGGHSKINMGSEIYVKEALKLYGKPYVGIKYTYPHIKYDKRYGRLHTLLYFKTNKIFNIIAKLTGVYLEMPIGSSYSIKDFEDMDAKIIEIRRSQEGVVSSMMRGSPHMTRKQALNCYHRSCDEMMKIKDKHMVSMSFLTEHPKEALEAICNYIGIFFEPCMLDGAGYNDNYKIDEIIPKQ